MLVFLNVNQGLPHCAMHGSLHMYQLVLQAVVNVTTVLSQLLRACQPG